MWSAFVSNLFVPLLLLLCVLFYTFHVFRTIFRRAQFISLQVIPCAVLSLFIHPTTSHLLFNRISWAFCVYLEAISVLPQLRLMQSIQVRQQAISARRS